MKIWDISQTLGPTIPVWPGEPAFSLDRLATISDDCPVNVGVIRMSLHSGAHADSPLHYDAEGVASAESELDPYVGECIVIDARHARGTITVGDIDWDAVAGVERVLFRTYERFPTDAWMSSFTATSPEVILRLRAAGVKLIGVDAPSLDPEMSKTLDAHQEVRRADMRILEGLVLNDVSPGRYELIALPLKIANADASPVRAILREIR